MKTLLTFGGGFLIAILMLSGFTDNVKPVRETEICHNCAYDNFKEVPLAEFMKDVGRYHGTHVKEVKSGLRAARGDNSVEPSRLCMYTLDTLKKFICFIETYAKEAKISNEGLGINFYYAVYPKDKLINGNQFGSLHTLYMVPTYFDPALKMPVPVDVKAMALYRREHPNEEIKIQAFSLPELSRRKPPVTVFMLNASSFSLAAAGTPPVINQGQLCPPACKLSTFDMFGSPPPPY